MPRYTSNGKTYNIPDDKVEAFLLNRPDAQPLSAGAPVMLGPGIGTPQNAGATSRESNISSTPGQPSAESSPITPYSAQTGGLANLSDGVGYLPPVPKVETPQAPRFDPVSQLPSGVDQVAGIMRDFNPTEAQRIDSEIRGLEAKIAEAEKNAPRTTKTFMLGGSMYGSPQSATVSVPENFEDMEAAKTQLTELRKLREAVDSKAEGDSFVSQLGSEFGRRAGEGVMNIATLGLSKPLTGAAVNRALQDEDNELSQEASDLISRWQSINERPFWADAASGLYDSAAFMAQMAATGGVLSGLTKGTATAIAGRLGGTKMAQAVGKLGGETATALVRTALAPSTYARAIEDNAVNPGSFLDAFGRAYTQNMIEFATEAVGKYMPGRVFGNKTGFGRFINRAGDLTGIQPGIGELGEEYLAEALHATVGDGQGDWASFVDPRFHALTAVTVGLFQLPYVAINSAGYGAAQAHNVAQKRSIRKGVDENVKNITSLFGESAPQVIETINSIVDADPSVSIPTLVSMVENDTEVPDEHKDAIVKYGLARLAYSGMERGKGEEVQTMAQEIATEVENNVNPQTGTLMSGKVKGQESPVQIVGGNIVLRDDGTIDGAASDREIYYIDEDGNRQVTSIDFLDSIDEDISAADAVAQATEMVAAPIVAQQENEEVREYQPGEMVRATIGQNQVVGEITAADPMTMRYSIITPDGLQVEIEPRQIVNEDNLQGVDNGSVVDYIDDSGVRQTAAVATSPELYLQGLVGLDNGDVVSIPNIIGLTQAGGSTMPNVSETIPGVTTIEGQPAESASVAPADTGIAPNAAGTTDVVPEFVPRTFEVDKNVTATENSDGTYSLNTQYSKSELKKSDALIKKLNEDYSDNGIVFESVQLPKVDVANPFEKPVWGIIARLTPPTETELEVIDTTPTVVESPLEDSSMGVAPTATTESPVVEPGSGDITGMGDTALAPSEDKDTQSISNIQTKNPREQTERQELASRVPANLYQATIIYLLNRGRFSRSQYFERTGYGQADLGQLKFYLSKDGEGFDTFESSYYSIHRPNEYDTGFESNLDDIVEAINDFHAVRGKTEGVARLLNGVGEDYIRDAEDAAAYAELHPPIQDVVTQIEADQFAQIAEDETPFLTQNVFKSIDGRTFNALVRRLRRSGLAKEIVTDIDTFDERLATAMENGNATMRNNMGDIYGFVTPDGTVYVDRRRMNANTPIHEFGHLWNSLIRENNPDLWARGVELVRNSEYWTMVNDNPTYQGLSDERKADEALAMTIGDSGESGVSNGDIVLYSGIKGWLYNAWNWIKEAFGIASSAPVTVDVGNMTLADFSNLAVNQILSGQNLQNSVDNMTGEDVSTLESADGFSAQDISEMEQIKATTQADGTFMIAPNGQPTNLTERQWLQVRTSPFIDWFGDWINEPENTSKVIDENGEPRVVYHGSGSAVEFNEFDSRYMGINGTAAGQGFYFTTNPAQAESYRSARGQLFEVFLNLRKPLNADRLTITRSQARRIIDTIDKIQARQEDGVRGYFLSNYGDPSTGITRVLDEAARIELDSSESDVEFVGGLVNGSGSLSDVYEGLASVTGHDGVIAPQEISHYYEASDGEVVGRTSENDIHYVVGRPNQIKSATDNSGEFNPETGDIRFQSVAQTADEVGSTMTDDMRQQLDDQLKTFAFRFREAWEDRYLAVKRFLDLLRKNGVTIAEYNDYYKQATALPGKIDAQMGAYGKQYQTPLNDAIRDLQNAGFEYRDIENYVILKHGLERNAWMAAQEENGRARDDYSGIRAVEEEVGMTANEYIARFEEKAGAELTDNLWARIKAATNYSLKKQLDGGILSREIYDDLMSRYAYYVPLRGHDAETAADRWDYGMNMGTYFVSPLQKARGRSSRAESPFAYIFQMAQSAVRSANTNMLNQSILRLAQKDKTGLMDVSKAWYVQSGQNADGVPTYEVQAPEYSENPEQYQRNIDEFEARMRELEAAGQAKQVRSKLDIGGLFIKRSQAQQHEVHVFQNGTEYVVYINANPAVADAINGDNVKNTPEDLQYAANITRQMAANFTTRNPVFVLSNFSRDYIYSSSILGVKENAAYALQFQRNILRSGDALQRYVRGAANMDNMQDRYLSEYIMNGAKTGFSHIIELQQAQRQIEREIARGNRKSPLDYSVRPVLDALEAMNEIAENMSRLSVYITSREMGRSIMQSVSDAKEVTVNFNRRGAGGYGAEWVRPLYLFINAGIQALSNFAKVAVKNPGKSAALIGGYAMTGFLMPFIANLLGGDDGREEYGKLGDWERQNNLCIYTGKGFIKIPLPHELRVFHRMGDNVYQWMFGQKDGLETTLDTMLGFADLVPMNPMGAIDGSWADMMPDGIKPFFQLAANRTFTGSRIQNEWADPNKPGYLKLRTNKKGDPYAPAWMVKLSQGLDDMTGGDGVKKGVISINPDVMNHLIRGYFGGLYTMTSQGLDIASKTIDWTQTGELELKVRETPLRTFFTSSDDLQISGSGLQSRYFKVSDEVQEALRQIKGYRKQVEDGELGVDGFAQKIADIDVEKVNRTNEIIKQIKRWESELKNLDGKDQKTLEREIANLKGLAIESYTENE